MSGKSSVSRECTIVCDGKGRAIHVCFSALEVLGIEAKDAIGLGVAELLGKLEGDTEALAAGVLSAIERSEPFEKNFEFLRPDKTRRVIATTVTPVVGAGDTAAFTVSVREATEHVRLEEILERYAEGLTILYEISNDFLSKTGMRHVLTGALDMIKELYKADVVQVLAPVQGGKDLRLELLAVSGSDAKQGVTAPLSQDSIEGRSMTDLCPVVVTGLSSDAGALRAEFTQEGKVKSGIGVPMVVGDRSFGVLSILYAEPRSIDTAELWYLNVLANSLAVYIEKERSLGSLSQSERFLNSVLEGIGEGVVVIGPDMKVISANRGYLDSVGRELDDVIGQFCYVTSHNRNIPCYEAGEDCTVKKVYETGKPHASLHEHVDSQGRKLYVQTRAYPIYGPDGKEVVAAVETLMNITESVQLEKDLEKRVKELEDFYDMAVGRELRMVELKDEIESLKEELSKSREQ